MLRLINVSLTLLLTISMLTLAYADDSTNVTRIMHYRLPSYSDGFSANGTIASVMDRDAGALIFNITDPMNPVLLSTYPLEGWTHMSTLAGRLEIVSRRDHGFSIFDITDASSPTLLSTVTFEGYPDITSCVTKLPYAYFCDSGQHMYIYDISNPNAPVRTGTFNSAGNPFCMKLYNSYAFIASLGAGLEIVDISDPTSPQLVSRYQFNGEAWQVYIDHEIAYISGGYAGLLAVDISNPSQPTLLGSLTLATANDYGASSVIVSQGVAYVGDFDAGLRVVDVSTPGNMAEIGHYRSTSPGMNHCQDLVKVGNTIFAADGSYFSAYRLTSSDANTSVPEIDSSLLPKETKLEQNYPNPYNSSTWIRFSVAREEPVTIRIFDVNGRLIANRDLGNVKAGNHEMYFNGAGLSSGTYFYQMRTSSSVQTKQMFLLK